MIIELYTAPDTTSSGEIESPVSNTTGELPGQEPTLNPDELLGSFDSKDEAIAFVTGRLTAGGQLVTDTQSAPFDAYSHIEWLTITIQTADRSTRRESYYLVTDEGY